MLFILYTPNSFKYVFVELNAFSFVLGFGIACHINKNYNYNNYFIYIIIILLELFLQLNGKYFIIQKPEAVVLADEYEKHCFLQFFIDVRRIRCS